MRAWLSPRYTWRRLSHHWLLKLLALVVAAGLWFVATAERRANVEQGFDVAVTTTDLTGDPAGGDSGRRTVSGLRPTNVKVYLRGKPALLNELRGRPQALEAVIDLTNVPVGGFNENVEVRPPTGTTLVRVQPERVQGFVDLRSSRTLPVTVSVAVPSEDSIPRYEVEPAQATVSGPSRVVDQVGRLVIAPLSLAPGEASESPLIALDSANRPLSGLDITPASTTLRRLDTGNLPIKALPVVLSEPPAKFRVTAVSVQPSSVRVVAAPELLAQLREISGEVAYRVGTYTAPVRLKVPAGAQALESVSVRLSVEPREP